MSRRRGPGWHRESSRHADAASKGWDGRRQGDSGPPGHAGVPDPRLTDPYTGKEYDNQEDWIDAGHCPPELCIGCGDEKVVNDDRLCKDCHRKSPKGDQKWKPTHYKGEPLDPKFSRCTICKEKITGDHQDHIRDQHRDYINEALGEHYDEEMDYFQQNNIEEVGTDTDVYKCIICGGKTFDDPRDHIAKEHHQEIEDAADEHEDDEVEFLVGKYVEERTQGKYGFSTKLISGQDWMDEADNEFDKELYKRLRGHTDDEIEYLREEFGREPTSEEVEGAIENHRDDEIKDMLESGKYPVSMIVTDEKTGREFNRLYFKNEGEANDYHDMQTEYGFDPRSSDLSVKILDERESEKVQAPAIPKDWDSDSEQERALYNAMDSLDDGGKIRLLRVHYFPQTEQITSVEIKEYDDSDDYEDDVNDDIFEDPTKDIILTPETEEAAMVKYQPGAGK